MCSNWLILPLQSLDDSELELQRCCIPYQPNDFKTSGSWCKCVLDDSSYTICRLEFRASAENCCFVDNVVASAGFIANKQHLLRLETLNVTANVERVYCKVNITEKLLQRQQISLEQLHQILCIFLRHLKLIKGCVVRHARLLDLGISSIDITDVAGTDLTSNSCFEITKLEITDVHLSGATTVPCIEPFLPHGFEAPLQALEQLLQSVERPQFKGMPLNALLVGPVGSGKTSLLAEFLRRHQCNCFNISASQVLRSQPGETEAELRRIFQAAHDFQKFLCPKQPIVILLEDLELLCPATSTSDARNSGNAMRITAQLYKLIDDLPHRSNGTLCLASSSSPDAVHPHARRAGRFGYEISIEMPTEEQRRQLFSELWQQQVEGQKNLLQLELLTPALLDFVAQHTQGYVIADLTLLLRQLQRQMLNSSDDFESILKRCLLQCQPSASRATDVRVLKLSTGFESIGGMDALKRTLQVSVLAALQHSSAHARFGLSLPKGLLLYGPPGCAKTSIAKCLAKEAHMTFIASSAAEVYSPYVGCAERFITQIFNTARKNAPCLIFLDEIDALVGRRTITTGSGSGSGGGGGAGVQLRILSTLLTEMDGIVSGDNMQHILVVAATNRPDMVDDALLRPGRFDKLIHVPAPDTASRLALLQLHAQRMPFHADVQLDEIAARTERYSGADLCNLCNEAAIEAFQRNFDVQQIERQDFETVLARQKSSLSQQQIESYYQFAARHL